jgi:2-dehydropantoate 2-reductase
VSTGEYVKILVYGAGVTGSIYAARLARAGVDVSLLARGQRLDDIREHGVVLEDYASGQRSVTFVPTVQALAPDDVYDLVVVMVRKTQVSSVLPALAANRHTPCVLFLMNSAAGHGAVIEALGLDRVLLGFPGVGGVQDGGVIRCAVGAGKRRPRAVIGEPFGIDSVRLIRISDILSRAGFAVAMSRNIDAWLKGHVALVSPMANALYLAGGDIHRLARTRDGLVLTVRAIREGKRVLAARGIPIMPVGLRLIDWVPEPFLVFLLSRLLDTRFAELGVAGHVNAARDEMRLLANEFKSLSESTSVSTPAVDILYDHIDPATPATGVGSARIPLDWRQAWVYMSVLGGVVGLFLIGWLFSRHNENHD